MKQNTKIFVSAFACCPGVGSEPGVGWHWVLEMAKYYDLWVLTHIQVKDYIDKMLNNRHICGGGSIHFVYTQIPFNSWFHKGGKFRWVRTYYLLWTVLSNKVVKQVMQENNIHIFHHITFGNAIWPVCKFGQKQTFIWGPIGGVETIDKEFSCHYDLKSRALEWIRRVMVKSLKYRWGFNQRCKNADLILCKTKAMRMAVPEKWRKKAILFTDVAVENSKCAKTDIQNVHRETIEILSVGRLDGWRGFDLLFEAFGRARHQCPQIHLTLLGNGLFRSHLEALRYKLKLEDVVDMLGEIPVEEYKKRMAECDFVVNSCLKEGAVTVSFDSMRYAKPLICIDTGGYTRYFDNEYAIVLPLQDREHLISALSNAIIKLASNPEIRLSMGKKANKAGNQFLWSKKGELIRNVIEEIIDRNND